MGCALSRSCAIRRAFNNLDVDKKGELTLDQILEAQSLPGVATGFSHSLLTLAFFDKTQTGSLNLEEFISLVRHLQTVNPSVSSRLCSNFNCFRPTHRLPSRNSSITSIPDSTHPHKSLFNSQWSQAVEHGSENNPPSPTHSVASFPNSRSNSLVGTGLSDDEIELLPSKQEFPSHFHKGRDSIFSGETIWDQLQQTLTDSNDRVRVIEWMFKLANFKGQDSIGNDELAKFLAIVNFDGIPLNSLLFSVKNHQEAIDNNVIPLRIKEVVNEFDTTGDGTLSRTEFFKLADLVLSEFELSKSRSMKILSKLGRYVVSRTLGFGAQAVVKLAFDPQEDQYRAIKIIKKSNEAAIAAVESEIKALKVLDHPNIIKLYNIIESQEFVFLILELASGGTLFDYFTTMPSDEAIVRFYFRQIVDALEHCHSAGIVHRDLRLENLLVDDQGNLKMNDFGHAGFFKDPNWDLFSTTDAGSIYHLCPEQCLSRSYSGRARDIWSLGILLYSLLTRKRPFDSTNIAILVNQIVNGMYSMPTNISLVAADLIGRLLSLDPSKRPTISEVKYHPFMWGEVKVPALALGDIEVPKSLLTCINKPLRESEDFLWNSIIEVCQRIGIKMDTSKCISSVLSPVLFEARGELADPSLQISIKWCRRPCSLCTKFPFNSEVKITDLPLHPTVQCSVGDHALPCCRSCNSILHLELKKGHSWAFHKLYFRVRTALNQKFEELENEVYQNMPPLEESQPLSLFQPKKIKPRTLHMREIALLFSQQEKAVD
ncbi:hypothetical protein P9112_000937 [Eukaryota sp. TZLM1-RC]